MAAGAAIDGAAPKLNVCPLAGNPNEGAAAGAAAGAAVPNVKAVAPAVLPNEKLMFLQIMFRVLCRYAARKVVVMVCGMRYAVVYYAYSAPTAHRPENPA